MKIRRIAESPLVYEAHKVQAREMYEKSGTTAVYLMVEKDGELPPHAILQNAFFFIISGQGKVLLGEDSYAVEAGMLVKCPKDMEHGLVNTGKEPLTALLVKTPSTDP